jgi:MarR family 2-MHQ and catechol resistance regulon transcriptional repressor
MHGVEDPRIVAAVRAYVKLMRASHEVTAAVEPRLLSQGLTGTQLGVLEAILHRGAMSHRELGRKVLSSPANITDVVDKLEARGLVARVRHASDRRQILVELTGCGRSLIEAAFPPHARAIAAAIGALDDDELAQLDRLLRKLGLGAMAPAGVDPAQGA